MADTFGVEIDATHEGLDRDSDGWEHNRWSVILTRYGKSIRIDFRMGTGLVGEPTLRDVLESLQLDARIEEYDEYDEILAEVPYSKARRMEQAIKEQYMKAKHLFGDDWEAFMEADYG